MKVLVGYVISRKTGQEMPIYEDFTEEDAKRIEESQNNALADILKDCIKPQLVQKKIESGGVI